jgi:CHRD domain
MSRTLRRTGAAVLLVSVAALAFALPASAGGRPYHVSLSGAAERPDPGDPDATGTADITVNPGTREVCWSVSVQNVDLPLVAAHIHVGDATVAGPPVIFLIPAGQTDADGVFSGCATVDRSLALQLVVNPDQYYVNVHTALFQPGAARGQLG